MKVIASDFDGTIYFREEENKYKQIDVDAIKEFQQKGNKFGLCTGRPLAGILPNASKDFKFDFYICNSGAAVYDSNCNVIFKKYIDFDVLKRVNEVFNDVELFVMNEKSIHILRPNSDKFPKKDVITSLDEIAEGEELLGFSLHYLNSEDALKNEKKVKELFPEVSPYVNVAAIDCVAQGCSKKTGLYKIMEYYSIQEENMACIGDNYNDLPMLEAIENSFTFTSSPEKVKELSKFVVNYVADCIEFMS